MALLIVAPGVKTDSWKKHLLAQDPTLPIRVWPEVGNPNEIEFALAWNHPLGEFSKFGNLQCIASLGAGVDHVLRDPDLPSHVPVTRVVEPSMPQSMSEYVILAVLSHCRHFDVYRTDQARGRWQPRIPLLAGQTQVGVLGLGQLGGDAARKLTLLGFAVAGWSRTPKKLAGIKTFAGDNELDQFLAQSNILVCLLPLTPATRGILNRRTFDRLPAGAYLINVARGEHLVEEDLLLALESGRLSGACLDVFHKEPLPEDHPFWRHPNIIVTPHISSLTYPRAVAAQIVANYHRIKSGEPPMHVVDRQRGY